MRANRADMAKIVALLEEAGREKDLTIEVLQGRLREEQGGREGGRGECREEQGGRERAREEGGEGGKEEGRQGGREEGKEGGTDRSRKTELELELAKETFNTFHIFFFLYLFSISV